jgi:hypothetical protein
MSSSKLRIQVSSSPYFYNEPLISINMILQHGTAATLAAQQGQTDVLSMLIENDADLNITDVVISDLQFLLHIYLSKHVCFVLVWKQFKYNGGRKWPHREFSSAHQ